MYVHSTAWERYGMPFFTTIKFRLYPVAPNNSRILHEDIVLSGYKVPAGVRVLSYYFFVYSCCFSLDFFPFMLLLDICCHANQSCWHLGRVFPWPREVQAREMEPEEQEHSQCVCVPAFWLWSQDVRRCVQNSSFNVYNSVLLVRLHKS